jgi:peptide-methionine (S)-S-oxide reductase
MDDRIGQMMTRTSTRPSLFTMIATSIFALLLVGLVTGSETRAQTSGAQTSSGGTQVATFAGGCFWCSEVDFLQVDGVLKSVSGFIGGTTKNPTYRQVTGGNTGHTEAVQITFDPSKVTYERLLYVYWRTVDPFDAGGQFCDRGDSYRTGIFSHSADQKQLADTSKSALTASGRFKQKIVTEVTPAAVGDFTAAEEYHQNFYKKDPGRYYSYRAGCGRDARVKAIWGAEAGGKVVTQ